jgi:hypothetical protein
MSTEELPILVTVSEIAGLFAEGRLSVVTNWRARSATFPADRSAGSTQPVYEIDEVIDWLRTDGPRDRSVEAPDPMWWWSKSIEAVTSQVGADTARSFLVALVLLRHLSVDTDLNQPESSRWRSIAQSDDPLSVLAELADYVETADVRANGLLIDSLRETTIEPGVLRALLGHFGRVADTEPAGALLDRILRTASPAAGTKRPLVSTTEELTRLIVTLAAVEAGDTVFDPAAGEGGLLAACSHRAGPGVTLTGQEIVGTAWRTARSRFLIAGVPVDLGARASSSLTDDQFEGRLADVVVIDPPVTAGGRDLAQWLDHGRVHLKDSGRLIIALPAHACVDVTAARRKPDKLIRRNLDVRLQGTVEAVVVLPRRIRADVVGPLAVFAFRLPADLSRPTLLIAPHVRETTGRQPADMGPFITAVDQCIQRWRHDQTIEFPGEIGSVEAIPPDRVLDHLETAVTALEHQDTSEHTRTHTAGSPASAPDPAVTRLRNELAELTRAARDLDEALRDHLDDMFMTDPAQYWRIRDKLDALMNHARRPGR